MEVCKEKQQKKEAKSKGRKTKKKIRNKDTKLYLVN